MLYTGGDGLSLAAREGFATIPFCAVDWASVAQTVEALIAARSRPSQMGRLWAQFLVDTVPGQVRDLEGALQQWPADVVICDIAMWAPILILHERRGVPVVPFSHVAYCLLPGPDGPVQGVALPRRRKGLAVLRARLAAAAAAWVTSRTRVQASAMRRQFGLAPLSKGVNELAGTLPLYLVPSAPEFDNFRRDLPPSVRYVGPCLWDRHDREPPARWVAEVASDQPCVVVDEGALFTREPRLLEVAAQGLAGLPGSVILLAGDGRDLVNLDLGRLAPNVVLHPHTSLREVLPICRVLVTNGNSESVMAALAAGIPLVVMPSIWDQAEMAWRVHETGVGVRIAPRKATPRRMRQTVERVMADPAFRANARTMGERLARYGCAARAVEYIEELVNSPSTMRTDAR
jgi:MGT family glycosyltransferase